MSQALWPGDLMIRLGLLGAEGRMGKAVEEVVDRFFQDKGKLTARATRNHWPVWDCDVIIDFSSPAGTLELLGSSASLPPVACGTTGWTQDQRATLEAYCQRHRVLLASNFSTSMMVMHHLVAQAGPLLESLGYEPVICETHHRYKRDAPSGTARALQRSLRPDAPESIQTHAVRAGEIPGKHTVTFYGPADQLALVHEAQDRRLFAHGAINVALWMVGGKSPGLLSTADYFTHLQQEKGDHG